MEAGIDHVVLADRGGDGADIADVLDHRGERERDDREDGAHKQAGVEVSVAEEGEHGALAVDGQADPRSFADGLDNMGAGGGVNDQRKDVGAEDAEQDGDDLSHALAPHIEADDDRDGDDGDEPVGRAVGDGGGGERQADGDDDRTGDDRGEEAHDLLHAEGLEERGEDDVHETRRRDADTGVDEKLGFLVGGDGLIAADERERGAEERGDLALGEQVEEQCAETGEEQRGGNVQTGQRRDKDGRAEHGKHVLQSEHQHARRAEGARVVNGFGSDLFLCHNRSLLYIIYSFS